jgi:SSS family solute:Na+ symporter
MSVVFLSLIALMVVVSMISPYKENKGIEVHRDMFKLEKSFSVGALLLMGVIAALYIAFW